jgi:putative addiction module component (TIGR02574 family)
VVDFNSVFNAAQQLQAADRLRLLNALWDTAPADADVPLHDDWSAELEKRVAAIQAGEAALIPWTEIRQAALARIGHGTTG